jgi:sec-independent protein translocase protein TatA
MSYVLLLGMPGGGELFFIVLIVIMLFGSKKIPELARGLGKGMREIKNATGDIQKEIRDGAREMNIPKNPLDIKQQVKDMVMKDDEEKKEKEDSSVESKPVQPKNTNNPTGSVDKA